MRIAPLMLLFALPGCAQSNLTEVAGFLADLRTLKIECQLTGRPDRVTVVVEQQKYALDDFLPGEKYYRLVQNGIERRMHTARTLERKVFCSRLAETVRRSRLNKPYDGGTGNQRRGSKQI